MIDWSTETATTQLIGLEEFFYNESNKIVRIKRKEWYDNGFLARFGCYNKNLYGNFQINQSKRLIYKENGELELIEHGYKKRSLYINQEIMSISTIFNGQGEQLEKQQKTCIWKWDIASPPIQSENLQYSGTDLISKDSNVFSFDDNNLVIQRLSTRENKDGDNWSIIRQRFDYEHFNKILIKSNLKRSKNDLK